MMDKPNSNTPTTTSKLRGDILKTLTDRIADAKADRENDHEDGERADLLDYEVELPLATAKAIAAALASSPAPQMMGCDQHAKETDHD